jgi:uncharacterized membrane protein
MNGANFLSRLRDGLTGLPQKEIDEMVADYAAHFSDGAAAGRNEDDVAAALGDPARLARELRAEAGLRHWEQRRTAGNFIAAIFAFIGLATVDVIVLLPLLFVVALLLFIFAVVLFALLLAGIGLVLSMLLPSSFVTVANTIARGFAGAGLVAGAIGGGALLLLIFDGLVRLLGRYTRVHYRLLNPGMST